MAGPDRIQTPNWTLTLVLAAAFALVVGGPQRSPTLLAQATTWSSTPLTISGLLTSPIAQREVNLRPIRGNDVGRFVPRG